MSYFDELESRLRAINSQLPTYSKCQQYAERLIGEAQEVIQYHTKVENYDNENYHPVFFHLFAMSMDCLQDMGQLLSPNVEEYRYSPAYYFAIRELTDNFIDYYYLLYNIEDAQMKLEYLQSNTNNPFERSATNWHKDKNREVRFSEGVLRCEGLIAVSEREDLKYTMTFISKLGHTDFLLIPFLDKKRQFAFCTHELYLYYNGLAMATYMLFLEYRKLYKKSPTMTNDLHRL